MCGTQGGGGGGGDSDEKGEEAPWQCRRPGEWLAEVGCGLQSPVHALCLGVGIIGARVR